MRLGKSSACVLLCVACACAARPASRAPAASTVARKPLTRAELQELSERHCAACHQSSVSRAKPAALAVFDLDRADWSAGLGGAQFGVFYQRMQGELDAVTRERLLAFTERAAERRPGPVSAAHPPE